MKNRQKTRQSNHGFMTLTFVGYNLAFVLDSFTQHITKLPHVILEPNATERGNATKKRKKVPPGRDLLQRRRSRRFSDHHRILRSQPHASRIDPDLHLPILVIHRVCRSFEKLHAYQPLCRFGIRIRNGSAPTQRPSQNPRRLLL